MLESDTFVAARSLMAIHGAAALAIAERSAANVRLLGMDEKAMWWLRVAKAIKQLETDQTPG
jgi:hypothetical protein